MVSKLRSVATFVLGASTLLPLSCSRTDNQVAKDTRAVYSTLRQLRESMSEAEKNKWTDDSLNKLEATVIDAKKIVSELPTARVRDEAISDLERLEREIKENIKLAKELNVKKIELDTKEREIKAKKEELRKDAIRDRYLQNVIGLVSNPNVYKIDEDDIDFVIGKKMILQDRQTGELEFVEDNKENQERAQKENKQIIRRDNSSNFNLGIGRNPTTIELIKESPELKARVDKFILKNPDEAFCSGLGQNDVDYPLTEEIQNRYRREPNLQGGYLFARKNTWKINDVDRGIVRSEETYDTHLARGAVRNNGYVEEGLKDVPQEDKAIVRKYPKHDPADILSAHPLWQFEEIDIEVAIDALLNGLDDLVVDGKVVKDQKLCTFSENILLKKLNRPLKDSERKLAHDYEDSDYAQVAGNRWYLEGLTQEQIQGEINFALEDARKKVDAANKKRRETLKLIGFNEEQAEAKMKEMGGPHIELIFGYYLFSNPLIPITDELINIATSETYVTTDLAESIAQRMDPLTEKAKQLATEKPHTSFAKGVRTNIAIGELNKVIEETEPLLVSVPEDDTTKELYPTIRTIQQLIEHKDKFIEKAKDMGEPSRLINDLTFQIRKLSQTVKDASKTE